MTCSVLVSDGSGEGKLWAYIANDGKPVPTGDLCAPPVLTPADGTGCQVLTVNGVPIRVTVQRDEDGHDVIVARRFLQGGYLEVVAQQSVPVYTSDGQLPPDAVHSGQPSSRALPALAHPFLTTQQVAQVAANPAALP